MLYHINCPHCKETISAEVYPLEDKKSIFIQSWWFDSPENVFLKEYHIRANIDVKEFITPLLASKLYSELAKDNYNSVRDNRGSDKVGL